MKNLSNVEKTVLHCFKMQLESNVEITLDSELNLIGLDSISYIKALVMIEDNYNFCFDNDKLVLSAFTSIRNVANYVYSKSLQN